MKYTNENISRLKKMLDTEDDNDIIEYIEFLENRNNKLASTLGWYEENTKNCRKMTKEGENARISLSDDGGQRARDVLSFSEYRLN